MIVVVTKYMSHIEVTKSDLSCSKFDMFFCKNNTIGIIADFPQCITELSLLITFIKKGIKHMFCLTPFLVATK